MKFVLFAVLLTLAVYQTTGKPLTIGLQHQQFHKFSDIPPFLTLKSAIAQTLKAQGPTVPLGGDIYPLGIYFLNAGIGSPSVEFKVALDTGSADLLVPHKGCVGCHLQNTSTYNPSASSSSKNIPCNTQQYNCADCVGSQCGFINSYQTCNLTDPDQPCTVKGPLYTDLVHVGGLSVDAAFGAFTFQTANFQQFYVIDGVMGFAGPGVASFGELDFFELLYKQNKISEYIFAICLNAEKEYPKSGKLTLGGINPDLHTGNIQYTPMTTQAFYSLSMESMEVKGNKVNVPWTSQMTIVDSGTNTLLLNTPTFEALKESFLALCVNNYHLPGVCTGNKTHTLFDGICFELSPKERSLYPKITLNFAQDVPMVIDGFDYLVPEKKATMNAQGEIRYCLGIDPTGQNGFTIVGDVVMQNYYFIFDRANNRLGVSPVNRANCLAA